MITIRLFDSEKPYVVSDFPAIEGLDSDLITLPDIFKDRIPASRNLDEEMKAKSAPGHESDEKNKRIDKTSYLGILELMPKKTRVDILMAKNIQKIYKLATSFTNPDALFESRTNKYLQFITPDYTIHPDNTIELKHRHSIDINLNKLVELLVTIRVHKDTLVKAFISIEDPNEESLSIENFLTESTYGQKMRYRFEIPLLATDNSYTLDITCDKNLLLFHLIMLSALTNKMNTINVTFEITSLTKYVPRTPITIITTKTEYIKTKKMLELFSSITNRMSFKWEVCESLLYLKRKSDGFTDISEELVKYNPYNLRFIKNVYRDFGIRTFKDVFSTSYCVSLYDWD